MDELSKNIYNCLDLFRCVPLSENYADDDEIVEKFEVKISKKAHWCKFQITDWLERDGLQSNIYKLIDFTSNTKVTIDAYDKKEIIYKCLALRQHKDNLDEATLVKIKDLLLWCGYKDNEIGYREICTEIFKSLYTNKMIAYNKVLSDVIKIGNYEIPKLNDDEMEKLATNYCKHRYLWKVFKKANLNNKTVCNRVCRLSKKSRKQSCKQQL